MARGLRTHILILAAIGGLTGALVPAMALSRDGLGPKVRVFHQTIGLTQNDLRDPDAVGAAVRQFSGSVYGLSTSHTSLRIPLSQFTSTVGGQAQRENWVSLVLEVWVGGDGSPAGYYVRYQGRSAAGDPVRGESFLTSPDKWAKPEHFPGIAGR